MEKKETKDFIVPKLSSFCVWTIASQFSSFLKALNDADIRSLDFLGQETAQKLFTAVTRHDGINSDTLPFFYNTGITVLQLGAQRGCISQGSAASMNAASESTITDFLIESALDTSEIMVLDLSNRVGITNRNISTSPSRLFLILVTLESQIGL